VVGSRDCAETALRLRVKTARHATSSRVIKRAPEEGQAAPSKREQASLFETLPGGRLLLDSDVERGTVLVLDQLFATDHGLTVARVGRCRILVEVQTDRRPVEE